MKPDNRLRITEIVARMNVGGLAAQVTALGERLDPTEFDYRLYTGHVAGGEGDHLRLHEAAISVYRVPGLGQGSITPTGDCRALRRLTGHLRAFRPHIIQTRGTRAGVLARIAARLSGVEAARIHVFHGHLPPERLPRLTRAYRVRWERFLAARSDRLVTVDTGTRDALLAAGIGRPRQFVVIPPGVRLGAVPDRRTARLALGLAPDVPVVAFVGRLTRTKRPDRLVEVAREVLRQVPAGRFLVCGSGELKEELERAVRPVWDSFRLLGWRRDVETVYGASDVVLLTSDAEGIPLALIEAGMAGVPVVSTRVGGVTEVVRDRRTGLLASRHPGELAAQTIRLLREPELARRMGEAARVWTTQAFDLDRLVADTRALYRSSRAGSRAGAISR